MAFPLDYAHCCTCSSGRFVPFVQDYTGCGYSPVLGAPPAETHLNACGMRGQPTDRHL